MGLEVTLPSKALSALWAVVHFRDARVLLFSVAKERPLALEELAAVRTGELTCRPMVGAVMIGNLFQ